MKTQKTISLTIFTVFLLLGNFSIAFASNINMENVVRLVNQSRTQHGLNLIYINSTLNKVAQDKANDMTKNHYFAHTSPTGISPWFWFDKNNYDYSFAGENLAINYSNAREQHTAWMNSPTHRKNILNGNYQEIGVGFSSGIIENKKASITVQVFGMPQSVIATNNQTKINYQQPKILGEKSTYLKQSTAPMTTVKVTTRNNLSKKIPIITPTTIKIVEKQTRNIIWLIILILTIAILRDAILKTIATPNSHAHRTANLVLLLMLWSILIGV